MQTGSVRCLRPALLALGFVAVVLEGAGAAPLGLDPHARNELADAGVNKYVDIFKPNDAVQIGEWTRYSFDTEDGAGPMCITGTELTVYHQLRDPKKLMIILDGGGGCWQDFYDCSITADTNLPVGGIFVDSGAGSTTRSRTGRRSSSAIATARSSAGITPSRTRTSPMSPSAIIWGCAT